MTALFYPIKEILPRLAPDILLQQKKIYKMQFQVFGGAAFGSSKIFDDFTSNSIQVNKYHYSTGNKIFYTTRINL